MYKQVLSDIALPDSAIELPGVSRSGAIAVGELNAGTAITLSGWPVIAFGVALAAAGCAALASAFLGAREVLGAPVWAIPAVGIFFAALGAHVTADGVAGLRHQRTADGRARATPDQPWLWDHAWREDGIGSDTSGEIARAFGFALLLLVLVPPLQWFLSGVKGLPWFIGFGLAIFDVVIVAVIARGVRLIRMGRRYGPSWLRFGRFPFRTGERLEATLDALEGRSELPSLNATLRCVQERYEMRGETRRNKNLRVVCYALWSASARVNRSAAGIFDFAFDIPADAPGSALSERPSRYWELVVASDDVPGVDYQARFLVPVYRGAS